MLHPLVLCLVLGSIQTPGDPPPNLLLIIADDLGVDRVGAYGEHPAPGHTPVLDALAAEGVLFRNAWSQPLCTTTRAALLSGRDPRRTGVGTTIHWEGDAYEAPLDEPSLAALLRPTHRTAAVGKWHLTADNLCGASHPLLVGFEHHRGSMSVQQGLVGGGYSDYDKNVDGTLVHSSEYATSETVDDALELVASFGDDPWFLWVAFNAPHTPIHAPPAHLHSFDLPADVEGSLPLHGLAMVEAMDREIGRLLDSLPPGQRERTLVVFVADNGTAAQLTTPPFLPEHAKQTVYEGGINVPLIVSGPGVQQGAECGALVSTNDVFATLLELAGTPVPPGSDSVSLAPYFSEPRRPSLRPWVLSECFLPNGPGLPLWSKRAVRNERYKLIRTHHLWDGSAEKTHFFDLVADPFEQVDLSAARLTHHQKIAFQRLSQVLDGAEAAAPQIGPGWTDVGGGFPGGTGGVPALSGAGSLQGYSPWSLHLEGASPGAPALLAVGLSPLYQQFHGGYFIPVPAALASASTSALGAIDGTGLWPTGLPSGLRLWFQFWVVDPGAAFGLAGSNAVVAQVP